MKRPTLKKMRWDRSGNALTEFALIAAVLFLTLGGVVDFFMLFWQWNSVVKALERGARIAAVSDPVAAGLRNAVLIGGANTPGDSANSQTQYDPIFTVNCRGGGQGSCTGAPPGYTVTYDATAMNRIVFGRRAAAAACQPVTSAYDVGMCHMFRLIRPENVEIEYRASHLGFYGRPGGPVVTVTLKVVDLRFRFFFLSGLMRVLAGRDFNDIILNTARSSITSEDLKSSGA